MNHANAKRTNLVRLSQFIPLILIDAVMISLASFLALYIRYEFDFNLLWESGYLWNVFRFAPINTILVLIIFHFFHLYSSLWEYAGLNEMARIVGASILASVLQIVGIFLMSEGLPRSFLILYPCFLATLIGLVRLFYRQICSRHHGAKRKMRRTMLIGAGSAGYCALREFQTSDQSQNRVVCIIDDNTIKRDKRMRGIPIVGNRQDILRAVEKYGIEEIVFAIPSASLQQRRGIMEICQQTKCTLKTLPSILQLANGEVSIQKIRNVQIEDLLGRDTAQVDISGIGKHVSGKVVLVTGGGGSIGSELCRQLAAYHPARLIIFDIYENNAYDIQQELIRKYPALHLTVLIGSVRDRKRLESVFAAYRPQLVYHAAAHKHVPLMEDSPGEAVKNNVFGTLNAAELADTYHVERFLLISSDKAVNPTNVMGATKRICEMVIQMIDRRSATEYVSVRFGNVLGSNGSVIPLFKKQIAEGGPVTVTDPQVIRYFMTIPEAVSLVLQAGVYAKGGEIFILDMGAPVRIDDLARNMIRLSGFEPDEDIEIKYIGLRPGEKLFEELLLSSEGLRKTKNDLIYIAKDQIFDDEQLISFLKELDAAATGETEQIRRIIAKIVPEYKVSPPPRFSLI